MDTRDSRQGGWVDLGLAMIDAGVLDGSLSATQAVVALQRMGHRVHVVSVAGEAAACVPGVRLDGEHVVGSEAEHTALVRALRPGLLFSQRPARLHAAARVPDRVVVGTPVAGSGCIDETLYVARDLSGWLRGWGGDRACRALALAGATSENVVPLSGRPRWRRCEGL